ncbi:MAG: hypothetical protein ACUVQM_06750 [Candidatus Hadarchaeaceae archaeon]
MIEDRITPAMIVALLSLLRERFAPASPQTRKRGGGNPLRGRSKAQVYAVVAKSRHGGTRSFLLRRMSASLCSPKQG